MEMVTIFLISYFIWNKFHQNYKQTIIIKNIQKTSTKKNTINSILSLTYMDAWNNDDLLSKNVFTNLIIRVQWLIIKSKLDDEIVCDLIE